MCSLDEHSKVIGTCLICHFPLSYIYFDCYVKVDLTAYVEKHEFCFDAVLDEHVTNDEVAVT